MSHGRSEPAELHRLRKQVKEAKVGPSELRKKKAKVMPLDRRKGKERCRYKRERERERGNMPTHNFKCQRGVGRQRCAENFSPGCKFHYMGIMYLLLTISVASTQYLTWS